MRTLDADLTIAQKSISRTPYISIKFEQGRWSDTTYTFTTADSPNRIKSVTHVEEPYTHKAVIVLDNSDLSLPDLQGYYCTIGYGYNTTSGDKKSDASPLWVKNQLHTSKMGSLDNVLILEGTWNLLARMQDIGSLLGSTSAPYYEVDYAASGYSIYDIIKQVLGAAGFGLFDLGGEDDGIIDTLQPSFVVGSVPFDDATNVIYRLLNMTKVFCRVEQPGTVDKAGPYTIQANVGGPGYAVGSASVRSSFYANGRYWQFYIDSDVLVFETSTDGETWAGGATSLGACTAGHYFSTYFDQANNKIHYTRVESNIIYYRKGTPESDGTITWDAVEQTAIDNGGNDTGNPSIVVSSEGYPWIAYQRYYSGWKYPYVIWSATTDGTWNTDQNVRLTTLTWPFWRSAIVALTNNRIYVSYSQSDGDAYGKLWDGSFGDEEKINDGTGGQERINSAGISIVAIGDDVHVVYGEYNVTAFSCKAIYRKRTYGTGWGTAEFVTNSTMDIRIKLVLCADAATQELYAFWLLDSPWRIIYAIRVDGTWSAEALLSTEDSGWGMYRTSLVTFDYIAAGKVMASYVRIKSGVFDVRTAWLRPAGTASFRIVYPSGYSSYDYTYTSDKEATVDHQFREFEWRDQPKIPNKVHVIANQSADGTWDNIITALHEYAKSGNNNYPDIVMYHVAATLANQGDADNRAEAIALRAWMEQSLGRVVVPHNCGQELYDWIKIRDKRGADSYTDYPTARWGNEAVVGSLVHTYDPANGVYDLEITINGIASSEPTVGTAGGEQIEELVEELVGQSALAAVARDVGRAAATAGVPEPAPIGAAAKDLAQVVSGRELEPFRPRLPQLFDEGGISPLAAALGVLTGSPSFRKRMMGQAVTYLTNVVYGPKPLTQLSGAIEAYKKTEEYKRTIRPSTKPPKEKDDTEEVFDFWGEI